MTHLVAIGGSDAGPVEITPALASAMLDDAARILAELQSRNGRMPYCDDTPVEIIKAKFGISKAAFKRALGYLMKQGKIEQADGWTHLKGHAE